MGVVPSWVSAEKVRGVRGKTHSVSKDIVKAIKSVAYAVKSAKDGQADVDGCSGRTGTANQAITAHLSFRRLGVGILLLIKEAQLLSSILGMWIHSRIRTGSAIEIVESRIVRWWNLQTYVSCGSVKARRI